MRNQSCVSHKLVAIPVSHVQRRSHDGKLATLQSYTSLNSLSSDLSSEDQRASLSARLCPRDFVRKAVLAVRDNLRIGSHDGAAAMLYHPSTGRLTKTHKLSRPHTRRIDCGIETFDGVDGSRHGILRKNLEAAAGSPGLRSSLHAWWRHGGTTTITSPIRTTAR
jgi:hypothetical protein